MPVKLSIVIPAKNEERLIGKCLDSIFAVIGDRTDIEVIVVDNGSTDGTDARVLERPRAKLIKEPKPGTSQARETGFRASQGALVGFIDADTEMPKDWIAKAEKEFSQHRRVVCLSGPYIYYDLPNGINFLVKVFYFIAYGVYVVTRFVFRRASIVTGGNYVVRREALEAIGGHNVGIKFYGDDTDIARRMSKVGEVKFSFGFPMYTSGRRFAEEGLMSTAVRYAINYFWIVLFGKPFTLTSQTVRPKHVGGGGEDASAPTRDWIQGFGSLLALLILVGGIAYGVYYVAQSGVMSTISFIAFKEKAAQEASALKADVIRIASSTKKALQNNSNESGQ